MASLKDNDVNQEQHQKIGKLNQTMSMHSSVTKDNELEARSKQIAGTTSYEKQQQDEFEEKLLDTLGKPQLQAASTGNSMMTDAKVLDEKHGDAEYATTPYRWLVLLSFCGMIVDLAIATTGFASYVAQIETAYGVETKYLYVLITIPTIVYAPTNFLANWCFNKFKIHHILYMAAVMQLSGAWIRSLGLLGGQENAAFWPVILGTFILFLANPLVLNSISVIANLWFADQERVQATAIASLMAPLGSLLGLTISGIVAAGVDPDDPVDCFERFGKMLYVQNGIFTFMCVSVLLCVREKPKTPPSSTALTFKQFSDNGIMSDMKALFKNCNWLLNAITFIINWGSYILLGNVLTPLFKDQFTSTQISIIGVIFVLTGVIGCYLMGLYIDKTQKHLRAIRSIAIALTVLYVSALVLVPLGILSITCGFAFLAGIFNVPILPSCYAYQGKLAPGIPPAVATGLMMSGAQLYSFGGSVLVAQLLNVSQQLGIGYVAVSLVVSSLCSMFIDEKKIPKEESKRLDTKEKEQSDEDLALTSGEASK